MQCKLGQVTLIHHNRGACRNYLVKSSRLARGDRVGGRSFSNQKGKGGFRESPYMVDTNVRSVSPSQIKIPFLSENVKQEMYRKHTQDSEEWTVGALSKQYGTSTERTKAVLFLMRRREQFKRDKGFDDIPKEWYELYQKYKYMEANLHRAR